MLTLNVKYLTSTNRAKNNDYRLMTKNTKLTVYNSVHNVTNCTEAENVLNTKATATCNDHYSIVASKQDS